MSTLSPTIGLEIHAEVKTKTKMFCGCLNDPDNANPNKNVCPICLGHPGTLPVANKEAIEAVVKLGLAIGGKIAHKAHFDRKSYFYPDLPKAYQISQYEEPLVEGGALKDIHIRRVHLEEDTGKLIHGEENKATFVDYNRAGVPLLELVTEPDIKTAEQAVEFAKELQLIMRELSISDADMEKGHMRIEVNISLSATSEMGVKVEVKNINSFRAVAGAINYEWARQKRAIERGEVITQETRGWNDERNITESQRSKESAHDYRYFPEPDIPPLEIDRFYVDEIKNRVPELPEAKRERFIKEFGLGREQVEILVGVKENASFFEEAASEFLSLKSENPDTRYDRLYNYLTSELWGLLNEKKISVRESKISPEEFAHLVFLVDKGELSSRLGKDVLKKMVETGEDPETLIKEGGMALIDDDTALEGIVGRIIEANPSVAEDYRKGKQNVLQFLIGKIMTETKGKANPQKLKDLLKQKLTK